MMMMRHEIGAGGTGLKALLEQERRRRAETAQAQTCGELTGILLPFSLALARLAARRAAGEAS